MSEQPLQLSNVHRPQQSSGRSGEGPSVATAAELDAIAEAVANLVAERLEQAFATRLWIGLVDAAELAGRLGVHESWVYAHAGDLEPIRLGDGPRARLRFDLQRVARVLGLTPAEAGRRPGRPRQHGLPRGVPLIQGRRSHP